MLNKFLSLSVVGLLLLGGLGAGISVFAQEQQATKEKIHFSTPLIKENEQFITVEVTEANSYAFHPGEPLLPLETKTFTFPFGTTISKVSCTPSDIHQTTINKPILPAPQPVQLSSIKKTTSTGISTTKREQQIYDQNDFYPETWMNYEVGVGLHQNQPSVILTVHFSPVRYAPNQNIVQYAKEATINVEYKTPAQNTVFPDEYDMMIIAPEAFSQNIQPLIDHKNSHDVKTVLKTTEEIYNEYSGRDKPEQIKYAIKAAIEEWGIQYVLIVGGLKSKIYAKPRDTQNHGTKGWYVPVRYSNLEEGEPGYVCDLYYSDVYKYENDEAVFDDWDSNGNDVFAEFGSFRADKLDMYPDVSLGRLACRNTEEVDILVNKIINYEQGGVDPSWFNRIVGITGDGFLDQEDLGFQWDTNGLPNGDYTIYAQSMNDEGESGPVEEINIEIDRSRETSLTFNHNDYERIENYPSYPAPPIAEIMTVSDGDVLGNTDYEYIPGDGEAYLNSYFGYGDVRYQDGVLHVSGKTYDPKLYGNLTNIHVWIENSNSETVFDKWNNNSKQFSEGDWTVGEKLLHGRAGAFYYMPDNFEKEFLSTANGKFDGMNDVIDAMSEGSGFVFFSGHGSPASWGNHYPGVPGNRGKASVTGLLVNNLFGGPPFFPMNEISNTNQPYVLVVGGCHNSMINVSLIPSVLDLRNTMYMHTYGFPTPECFSWHLVRLQNTGAIASMGNTGYGYGILGEWCTTGGLDNWITTEFFRQYGTEGQQVLGGAYSQTLSSYISTFGKDDSGHVKTVQQWILLGDPSLRMGGYQ